MALHLTLAQVAHACDYASTPDIAHLDLPQILARVAQCHPDVRAYKTRVAQAQGDSLIAQQKPNPQLSLGLNTLNKTALKDNRNWLDKPFDHLIRIDQTLERGRKYEERVLASHAGVDAAKAEYGDALRRAKLDAQQAYTDWVWAQASYQLLSKNVDLSAQALQAMQRRVAAGDAPEMDLTRWKLEDTRIQSEKQKALTEVKLAQMRLGLLMGVSWTNNPAATPSEDTSKLKTLASGSTLSTTHSALEKIEQRPDVQSALAAVTQAEHHLAAAQGLRSRDVSVGLQFNRYPSYIDNPSGTGNTVSLNLSVPLFLQHTFEGEIAKAEAELNTAQENLQNVRHLAEQEVHSAWTQLKTSEQRKQLASDILEPTARKLAQAAETAYQYGNIGMLERLDAQRNWRQAQIELLTSEKDWMQALWQYQFVTATASNHAQP
jgi:cobalt-zinc-cadmium efflux system outer membrane protein